MFSIGEGTINLAEGPDEGLSLTFDADPNDAAQMRLRIVHPGEEGAAYELTFRRGGGLIGQRVRNKMLPAFERDPTPEELDARQNALNERMATGGTAIDAGARREAQIRLATEQAAQTAQQALQAEQERLDRAREQADLAKQDEERQAAFRVESTIPGSVTAPVGAGAVPLGGTAPPAGEPAIPAGEPTPAPSPGTPDRVGTTAPADVDWPAPATAEDLHKQAEEATV